MTFAEVIEVLFSKRPPLCQGTLAAIVKVLGQMGVPLNHFPTIHIAGTNGKGSVSLKIAKALEFTGLKVGLFTSPHLTSFCERIVINDVPIPEEKVMEDLLVLFDLGPQLCFFDMATLLGLKYFFEQKVDVAVLEAGIGGLLDATNVVTPLVSIITSISLDHEDMLGHGLEAIAFQKAGIIKPGVPVVVGPSADLPIIRQKASECQSPLYIIPPQKGYYDAENSSVARQALEILKSRFPLTEAAIERGIQERPPCRFEQIGRVVFDVAHNPAGFIRLLEALELHFPERPFSAIVGMSKDKDIRACLGLLAARASHIYLVPTTSVKSASPSQMGKILLEIGYTRFTEGLSVEESLGRSLSSDPVVVVCGSFYLMQEAREKVRGIDVGENSPLLIGR